MIWYMDCLLREKQLKKIEDRISLNNYKISHGANDVCKVNTMVVGASQCLADSVVIFPFIFPVYTVL